MSEISEALRGPWVATVADRYGFLLDPEEIDDDMETRWEQAQAIANALNALAGSSSGGTT